MENNIEESAGSIGYLSTQRGRSDGRRQIVVFFDLSLADAVADLFPEYTNEMILMNLIRHYLGTDYFPEFSPSIDTAKRRRKTRCPRPDRARARRGKIAISAWLPAAVVEDMLGFARDRDTWMSKLLVAAAQDLVSPSNVLKV